MARYRLPCPDTDGDGLEDFDPAAGCTRATGEIPARTLGLSLPARLNYGVHQTAALPLTRLSAAHTPWLPPPATATTEWPLSGDTSYIPGAYTPPPDTGGAPPIDSPNVTVLGGMSTLPLDLLPRAHPTDAEIAAVASAINGLDFCAKLRATAAAPVNIVSAGGIPVAYALAHPGKLDADADGNAFDGGNAGAVFAAPHRPATALYDDEVLAAGFNELSARLSCPAYLASANAAGHTARAAYDNYRFTLAYLQYRAFALDAAYGDLQQAYASVMLGAVGVAGAIATGVAATSAGIMTLDEAGLGAVLTAAGVVLMGLGTLEGIAELVLAVLALEEAKEGAREAKDARVEAEAQARKIRDVAGATARRALALDAKGWLP
jgi:hypothetical protein